MEQLRCCIGLQHGERFAGYALARQPGCTWIASLGNSRAVSVRAGAVAAKEQLVFVPLEKVGGEAWITGERIVAGVRGKISEEVGIIGEPFVGNAAAHDGRPGVVLVVGIVRAD